MKYYTIEDYIRNEKIHQSNYADIHNLIQRIFYKNKDQSLAKEIIRVLNYTYEKHNECKKD